MTKYTNGRNFEYRIRDACIAAGYYVVRSAGSKGKIDLVALGKDTLLIQAKTNKRLNKEEQRTLAEVSGFNKNYIPLLGYRDGRNLKFKNLLTGGEHILNK